VIPVIGLALASAPDFAHYLPFLQPIVNANPVLAGLATVLAPAIAATIFVITCLSIIHCMLSSLHLLTLDSNRSERGCYYPWLHFGVWESTFRVQNLLFCSYHCCGNMACRHRRSHVLYASSEHE